MTKSAIDITNDTTKYVVYSIQLILGMNKGTIIPPENQATLIFPMISEALFN